MTSAATSTSTVSAVITFNEVSKSFRGRPLYSGVSFEVLPGRTYALVGPNGSGKSVLMRLMCGFMKPDSGHVSIDPKYLSKNRQFPDRFGVTIDRPGFMENLTGLQNLMRLMNIRKRVQECEVRDMMLSCGLDPDIKQKIRNYSLGMRQKVALSQALLEDPEVLILDEPFNGLDKQAVAELRERLKVLNEQGITLIFTSHNTEDVDILADSILTIDGDRVDLTHRR